MARYIDADKLIADGWHLERHAPNGRRLTMMSIADVPTADVEEVKHGEWIRIIKNGKPRGPTTSMYAHFGDRPAKMLEEKAVEAWDRRTPQKIEHNSLCETETYEVGE